MKHDQFELFFSPSYLMEWHGVKQPSVVVDYEYKDQGTYAVKYIAFAPEVLINLLPMKRFDIISEVNEAVHQRVVDYYTDDYMAQLERIGVKRGERI